MSLVCSECKPSAPGGTGTGALDRTSGRPDPGSSIDAGVLGRGTDTLLSPASPQVGQPLATCHQSEQDLVSLGVCLPPGQGCAFDAR